MVDEIEEYLIALADSLEPATHCCECERGERHGVHIQYPRCACPTPYRYLDGKWRN